MCARSTSASPAAWLRPIELFRSPRRASNRNGSIKRGWVQDDKILWLFPLSFCERGEGKGAKLRAKCFLIIRRVYRGQHQVKGGSRSGPLPNPLPKGEGERSRLIQNRL